MSIPSRVLISSNNSPFTKQDLDAVCQSLQGFSYLLTTQDWYIKSKKFLVCQSLQGFSYLLTIERNIIAADSSLIVSIPSRVLISSNPDWLYIIKFLLAECQSLQGFSYLLTSINYNNKKSFGCVNPFKGSHIF